MYEYVYLYLYLYTYTLLFGYTEPAVAVPPFYAL